MAPYVEGSGTGVSTAAVFEYSCHATSAAFHDTVEVPPELMEAAETYRALPLEPASLCAIKWSTARLHRAIASAELAAFEVAPTSVKRGKLPTPAPKSIIAGPVIPGASGPTSPESSGRAKPSPEANNATERTAERIEARRDFKYQQDNA